MLKSKGRILRYNINGGYRVEEEIWKCCDNDEGTKMVSAYSDDGSYIGNPKEAKYLAKNRGISYFEKARPEHRVVSIGFNKKEQKWYGWSHRALFGFSIGSEVKKGDCAYTPSTPQELFDDVTQITKDDDGFEFQWLKPENVEIITNGLRIREEMTQPPDYFWEMECGKGEWKAETLDNAKQMAIDFAGSVS
jgi:hypothetical protein